MPLVSTGTGLALTTSDIVDSPSTNDVLGIKSIMCRFRIFYPFEYATGDGTRTPRRVENTVETLREIEWRPGFGAKRPGKTSQPSSG